ncbi:MAG: dihydroorotate dehydrogenase [Candidatus Saliniplasma sp.]
MVEIETCISDIHLENPLLLASGILGQTAESMEKVLESGMGGVVTKSIGSEPREGHPNPTMVETEHGLLNAMGLPNPGIDNFLKELKDMSHVSKPIVGSVFAGDKDEFVGLSLKMEKGGVDAVELNLSCPHAEGYGAAIGTDPDLVSGIVQAVKKETNFPVFAKLPPFSDIVQVAVAAEESGCDAIVAINTVQAMSINFETRKPILGNKVGGYSGPAIKPIGIKCVYDIYSHVNVPVIGCGGITYGRDALEYIIAGASALEIGSAIYYRGRDAGALIADEMKNIMQTEDIDSINGLIGSAQQF